MILPFHSSIKPVFAQLLFFGKRRKDGINIEQGIQTHLALYPFWKRWSPISESRTWVPCWWRHAPGLWWQIWSPRRWTRACWHGRAAGPPCTAVPWLPTNHCSLDTTPHTQASDISRLDCLESLTGHFKFANSNRVWTEQTFGWLLLLTNIFYKYAFISTTMNYFGWYYVVEPTRRLLNQDIFKIVNDAKLV